MHEPDSQNSELLARFYREHIIPIAEKVAANGIELFPLGPDDSSESYFVDREPGESYLHTVDNSNLNSELTALWSSDRVPGMKDLAVPILELAEKLREKAQSDDVSPFIYAMF